MKKTASLILSAIILISLIITGCEKNQTNNSESDTDSAISHETSNKDLPSEIINDEVSNNFTSSEEQSSTVDSGNTSRKVLSSNTSSSSNSSSTKSISNSSSSIKVNNSSSSSSTSNNPSVRNFELYLPEGYADYMDENVIAGPAQDPFSIFVNINLQGKSSANVSLRWETTNESSDKVLLKSFKKINETRYEAKVSFPDNYTSDNDTIIGFFIATIDGKDYKSPTYTLFYRGGGGAGVGG